MRRCRAGRGTPEATESAVAKPDNAGSTDANASAASGTNQTAIQMMTWIGQQEQIKLQADLSLPMAILFALIRRLHSKLHALCATCRWLKIMAFAEQAGESRARVLWLNLWYTLGMLSVFWILSRPWRSFSPRTVEGTFLLGQQFTYIEFRLGMIILVFAMALSFLASGDSDSWIRRWQYHSKAAA